MNSQFPSPFSPVTHSSVLPERLHDARITLNIDSLQIGLQSLSLTTLEREATLRLLGGPTFFTSWHQRGCRLATQAFAYRVNLFHGKNVVMRFYNNCTHV